jgi:hypothetical protein
VEGGVSYTFQREVVIWSTPRDTYLVPPPPPEIQQRSGRPRSIHELRPFVYRTVQEEDEEEAEDVVAQTED